MEKKKNKPKSLLLLFIFLGGLCFLIFLNSQWLLFSPNSPTSNIVKDQITHENLEITLSNGISVYTSKLFENGKKTYLSLNEYKNALKKDSEFIKNHQYLKLNNFFENNDDDKTGDDQVDDHQIKFIHDENNENGNVMIAYDGTQVIFPETIPEPDPLTYPKYDSLLKQLERFNPDDPDGSPNPFYEQLQIFDWTNQEHREYAKQYRNAELPFKIINHPEVVNVVNKWDDHYLTKQFNGKIHGGVQESHDNHFMYFTPKKSKPEGWEEPTKKIGMKWNEWIKIARDGDAKKIDSSDTHYYFMVGTRATEKSREPTAEEIQKFQGKKSRKGKDMSKLRGSKHFVVKDLSIFSTPVNNFFITNVQENNGIQCRFAMRGIISESHYDTGKNWVAMLIGAKRYILNPPSECKKLAIIKDPKHPSWRHSELDWSNIEEAKKYGFDKVRSIDTIVRQGELLYIPSFWFHYIQALSYAVQCNSRSGIPKSWVGFDSIKNCIDFPPNFKMPDKFN